jgi:hypothetical protein
MKKLILLLGVTATMALMMAVIAVAPIHSY